jgi:hypothetical protein
MAENTARISVTVIASTVIVGAALTGAQPNRQNRGSEAIQANG